MKQVDQEQLRVFCDNLNYNIKYFIYNNISFFMEGDNMLDVYNNIREFTIDTYKTEFRLLSEILSSSNDVNLEGYFYDYNKKNFNPLMECYLVDENYKNILLEQNSTIINESFDIKHFFNYVKSHTIPWLISTLLFSSSDRILGLFQEYVLKDEPHFYFWQGIKTYDIYDYLRTSISVIISILIGNLIVKKIDNVELTQNNRNLINQHLELGMILSKTIYSDDYNSEIDKINRQYNKCVLKAKNNSKIILICTHNFHDEIHQVNKDFFKKVKENADKELLYKLNVLFKAYNVNYKIFKDNFNRLVASVDLSK